MKEEIDSSDTKIEKSIFSRTKKILSVVVAVTYLAGSLFFSVSFLVTSKVNLQNDYFWAFYNATTTGAYTISAINKRLNFHEEIDQPFDLTSARFVQNNISFSIKNPNVVLYPQNYGNELLIYDGLISLKSSIDGLRKLSETQILNLPTAYCWVDFNRRWEMAHSVERQKRCYDLEKKNGAVYLEAILRNTNFQNYSLFGSLNSSIIAPILKMKNGEPWYNSLRKLNISIDNEDRIWKQSGITKFTLKWQNYMRNGVQERIRYQNVFGTEFSLFTKTVAPMVRDNFANSRMFYWGFINDLKAVGKKSSSISAKNFVRGTENYAFKNAFPQKVYAENSMIKNPPTFQMKLWEKHIGPFGTVDIAPILPPPALKILYEECLDKFKALLLGNSTARSYYYKNLYHKHENYIPVRFQWTNNNTYLFHGGNPICNSLTGVTYVQAETDFYNPCASAYQYTFASSSENLILALIVSTITNRNSNTSRLADICSNVAASGTCVKKLQNLIRFVLDHFADKDWNELQKYVTKARVDLVEINIEMMQFAKHNNRPIFLRHSYLNERETSWDTWAWLMMMSWASRSHSILKFTGDKGSIALLTRPKERARIHHTEPPNEIAIYLLAGAQYVTTVLILVAFIAMVFLVLDHGTLSFRNLISFNRVTGAVWIGRPLLTLRAIVAISILCTGRLQIVELNSIFKISHVPRHIIETFLVGGEASWLNYVLADICCFITKGYTGMYCSLSILIVWVTIVIIEIVNPIHISTMLERKCVIEGAGGSITTKLICESGTISVGNTRRFILILAVNIMCMLACYILTRLTRKPRKILKGSELILPGIACEVLRNEQWTYQGIWHLDRASSVMCGLIPIEFGKVSRLLDVKSWSLLYLNGTHVSSCNGEENPITYPRGSKFKTSIKLSILNQKKSKKAAKYKH